MENSYYTHAMWRVQQGREAEFIEAWRELGAAFAKLRQKPLWGSLLQSITEPTLFYSFGPWRSLADIEAMRANPMAQEALARVRGLCAEANPGAYHLVAHIEVEGN
jgi:quinol monooxygenase YgiN